MTGFSPGQWCSRNEHAHRTPGVRVPAGICKYKLAACSQGFDLCTGKPILFSLLCQNLKDPLPIQPKIGFRASQGCQCPAEHPAPNPSPGNSCPGKGPALCWPAQGTGFVLHTELRGAPGHSVLSSSWQEGEEKPSWWPNTKKQRLLAL